MPEDAESVFKELLQTLLTSRRFQSALRPLPKAHESGNGASNGEHSSAEPKKEDVVAVEDVTIEKLEAKLNEALLNLRRRICPSTSSEDANDPIKHINITPAFVSASQVPSVGNAGVEGRQEVFLSENTFESGSVAFSLWLTEGEPAGELGWHLTHVINGAPKMEMVRLRLRTGEFWFGEQKRILALPQNFRFRPHDYIGVLFDIDRLAFSFSVNSVKLPEIVFHNSANFIAPVQDSLWNSIVSRITPSKKSDSSTDSPTPRSTDATSSSSTSSSSTASTSDTAIPPSSHLAQIGQGNRELTVEIGESATWRAMAIAYGKAQLNGGASPYYFKTHHRTIVDPAPLKLATKQAKLVLHLLFVAIAYMPDLSTFNAPSKANQSPSKVKISIANRLKPHTTDDSKGENNIPSSKVGSPSKTLKAIYDTQRLITAENASKLVDLLLYSPTVGLMAIMGEDSESSVSGDSSVQVYDHVLYTAVAPFLLGILRRNSERVSKTMISHFISLLKKKDKKTDRFISNVMSHIATSISLCPFELPLRNPSLVIDTDRRGSLTEWLMLFIRIAKNRRCFDLVDYKEVLFGNFFCTPALDHRLRLEPFVPQSEWSSLLDDMPANIQQSYFHQDVTDAVAARYLHLGHAVMAMARYKEEDPESESPPQQAQQAHPSSAPKPASPAPTSSSAPSSSSEPPSSSANGEDHHEGEDGSVHENGDEGDSSSAPSGDLPKKTSKPITSNNFLRKLRSGITQLPGIMRGQTAHSSNWNAQLGLMYSLLVALITAAPESRDACLNNVLFSNVLLDKTRANVDRLGGTFTHVVQTWPNPLEFAPTLTEVDVNDPEKLNKDSLADLDFPDASSGWMFELLDASTYLLHHSYAPAYANLMHLQNEYSLSVQVVSHVEATKRRRIQTYMTQQGVVDSNGRVNSNEWVESVPTGDLDMAITMSKLNRSHASVVLSASAYSMLGVLPQFLLFDLSQRLAQVILHTMDNPSRSDILHYFPESYVHAQIALAHILRFAHDTSLSSMAGWRDIPDDPQVYTRKLRELPEWIYLTESRDTDLFENPEKVVHAVIGRKRLTAGRRYNSYEEKVAAIAAAKQMKKASRRDRELDAEIVAAALASITPTNASTSASTSNPTPATSTNAESTAPQTNESAPNDLPSDDLDSSHTSTNTGESNHTGSSINSIESALTAASTASSSRPATRDRSDSDPVPPPSHNPDPDPTAALAIDPESTMQEELDKQSGKRRLAASEPPAVIDNDDSDSDDSDDEDDNGEVLCPRLWYHGAIVSSLANLVNRGVLLNPNVSAQILTILGKILTWSLPEELLALGPKRFNEFLELCFKLFVDKRLTFWTVVLEALLVVVVPSQANSTRYRGYTRAYLTDKDNKRRLKDFLNKFFNTVNSCQNELDALIDSYLEKIKLITTNVDTFVAAPSPSASPAPQQLSSSSSAPEGEGFSLDEALGFGAFASASQAGGAGSLSASLTSSAHLTRSHSTANLTQPVPISAATASSSAPQGFGPVRSSSDGENQQPAEAPAQPASQPPAAPRYTTALEEKGFPRSEAREGWVLTPTGHANNVQVELPSDPTERIALLRQLTPLRNGIDTFIRDAPLYFEVINNLLFVLGYFTQNAEYLFEDTIIMTRTCEIVGHTLSRALDSSGSPPLAKLCRLLGVAPKSGYVLPATSASIESLFEASAGPIIVSCTRIVCTLLTRPALKERALTQLAGLIPRRSIDTFLSLGFQHIEGWEETVETAFNALKMVDTISQRDMLLRSGQEECPICYANPVNTTFIPCNHRSCNDCIERHLLNNKQCFFCKADIVATRRDGGDDLKVSMN